jgi:predicted ATPase/class 3 adenylate cyclase
LAELPSGTVTFLFTDLEGSTRLWEQHPDAMVGALARHDVILREAIAAHDGHVVKTTGDGVHAVFAAAQHAVAAALTGQVALGEEPWEKTGPLLVRMGIHSGEAEHRDGDYFGTAVNRAARVSGAAHGGQVLCSLATEELVHDSLPGGCALVDLGEHRLRDLGRAERLFQLIHPALRSDFPATRSLDAYPTNLPVQLTSFVGRDRELVEIASALADTRIVTLTGVGGVGKTRLAVQTAADVLPRFRDGAWFVDLAPVRDRAAVGDVVAAALGLQPEPGQPVAVRLANFVRTKQLLLVVDNCEHVLDTAAESISELTRAGAGVRVLATSREGLALSGERILAVGSLPVPVSGDDLDAPAAQLFIERATAGGTVRLDDADAIVQICRRLDGVPLAIELAAARARSMSLTDLRDRLDQRFRLLTGGPRDALSRHQTLRQAIDWSYDLLSAEERVVLDRLAVFAGGWDLRAAETVVGHDGIDALDVVDLLGHLVEKSLVVRDDINSAGRYRLLETIRQYAQERLDATGTTRATRGRHAHYYADYLTHAVAHLEGPGEIEWTARLARDLDNLQGALVSALDDGDVDTTLRLVTCIRGPQASASVMFLPWADAAIRLPGAKHHPLYPRALIFAMFAASLGGQPERMAHLAEDALAANIRLGLPDDPRIHGPLAMVAMVSGDVEQARDQFGIAAELARAAGDDYLLNVSLVGLSAIFGLLGDTEQSARLAQEAAAAARRCGIISGLAQALCNYGWITRDTAPGLALAALDEAAELAARVGTPMALGFACANAAILRARLGDHAAARADARQAITAAQQRGDRPQLGNVLISTALALIAADAVTPAAILTGAAHPMIGSFFEVLPEARLLRTHLVTALGDNRVADLGREGEAMNDDTAIAFALAAIDAAFDPDA